MKIAIILGTRPEIIKMWSIIHQLHEQKSDYLIIHTNQHYSSNMNEVFFQSLRLPLPHHNLHVGSDTQGKQIALMLTKIKEILVKEKPDCVMVAGDTNTVLGGALAASQLGIKIAHVEAGLRSFDSTMPEEINRILTDHLSDYLFAPTKTQEKHLLYEEVSPQKIHIVGNSVADAVLGHLKDVKKIDYLPKHSLRKQEYFLITIHRAENTDNKERLQKLLKSLEKVYQKYGEILFYPIHPRTKKRIAEFKLKVPKGVILSDPLDYFEFLQLIENAKVVLTDSGGVQEEACILKTPCLTLRDNTERPETVEVGANIIAGTKPAKILSSIKLMMESKRNWISPFGNGDTGKKIIDIIQKDFNSLS